MSTFSPRPLFGSGLLAGLGLCLASCGGEVTPAAPTIPPTSSGTCAAGSVIPGTPNLMATRVVSGLSSPLDLQSAPGDRTRLFVVEQAGRIRILRGGTLVTAPFLDVSERISAGGERGLLGLVFHPQFTSNGRFFVNYTDRAGHTRISEFRSPTPGADTAEATSERELMVVPQPFSNHNGGGLAFGNDGFLYIALGDGGSAGDPLGNAQNLARPLGKILRIDVNGAAPFAVPPDNPFVGQAGALSEIWAYGLRNPWRFSFDRSTGDLYIGDVGQGTLEEINVGFSLQGGGENYGWNAMEGTRCFRPSSGCNMSGLTLPVTEYGRGDGFSVTGGVVYRGCRMPGYAGHYFYADFGSGLIRSFRLDNGRATEARDWTAALSGASRMIRNPSSFGVDEDGEIYIVDYEGSVYRIDPVG